MRTVYLNGAFVPEDEARVSVFDRGFTFGQGVYEVSPVIAGKARNWDHHGARLARSKATARIADDTDWPAVIAELIARNGLDEGRVYLQITGGSPADRDFLSPTGSNLAPTTVAYTQPAAVIDDPRAEKGLRVILYPEGRWSLRGTKTTQLLYAVLAKEAAREAGVDDAWFVDGDTVTEATSANAHLIDARGVLVSHPVDRGVLPGVTRVCLLEIARRMNLAIEERPFTVGETATAREAFLSGAGSLILPVVEIDHKAVGDGRPGPVTAELRRRYVEHLRQS